MPSIDTLWNEKQGTAWRSFIWTHSLLFRGFEADMEADGVPLDWFDVLIQLYSSPTGNMPLQQLARSVLLSRSGVTRLLDRIERAGYIKRTVSAADRRRFDIKITSQGRKAFERVWPGHQRAVLARFLRHLTDEDLGRLTAMMTRVYKDLE